MMTLEKPKKRGRPAQLLQVAELHGFVEFLLEKDPRTELQNQVIDVLQTGGCNFEMLSEAQQILVKEALKPYREHLKLKLLFEELNNLPLKTEYEQKIVDLYQDDQKGNLDLAERNILKTMCTRYYRFKAQQLKLKDLELYLSQIQKKDEGKKRKAENQLKFELGGAVLAAFKKLNKEIPEDRSKVTNSIVNNANFWKKVSKTKIYSAISTKESTYFEDIELFIKVIDGLTSYSYDGQQLFEYEILKQKKLDKK